MPKAIKVASSSAQDIKPYDRSSITAPSSDHISQAGISSETGKKSKVKKASGGGGEKYEYNREMIVSLILCVSLPTPCPFCTNATTEADPVFSVLNRIGTPWGRQSARPEPVRSYTLSRSANSSRDIRSLAKEHAQQYHQQQALVYGIGPD